MVSKRGKKLAVVMMTCGTSLMGFGGCLGLNLERLLQFGAAVAATEFVLDNDAIFDLFPDGTAGN